MTSFTRDSAILDIAVIEEALAAGCPPPFVQPKKGSYGAVHRAAKVLGVSRQVLEYRIKPGGPYEKMGLTVDWFKWNRHADGIIEDDSVEEKPDDLKRAAARGELGTDPVLPGFEIKSVSTQLGPDGRKRSESIKQAQERGAKFEMPEGHLVKGVSALLDPDGRTIAQWVKTREGDNSLLLVDAIKSAFEEYRGHAQLPPRPEYIDEDLLTTYVIGDHHLGLYTWAKETGDSFDLKIGEQILLDTMGKLVSSAPASGTAVVLNLGDFFHSDTDENRTQRSGHALDVDTRYAKVLQVGIRLMTSCIEMALQRHDKVIVRCLPGNHDPHTSLALTSSIAAFFHTNDRVTIDCNPDRFFFLQFGRVLLSATHGDKVRPEQMSGVVAAMQPVMWGETYFRYAYFGHVHHKSKVGTEKDGLISETFQVLAPKDAWHHGMGFTSGRSMVSITHHKERGEIMRHTVSVKGGS
jgi:hypothetical protein